MYNGEAVREIAVVVLTLPDGRLVLQRRTEDAPVAPGLLGLFGGHIEEGETPDQAIRREIQEETSLDLASVLLQEIGEVEVPHSAGFGKDRRFYVYQAALTDDHFKVFEGTGHEAYTTEELETRTDVSETVLAVLKQLL